MNQHNGTIGKKLGMTQFFATDGNVVRCSVIEVNVTVVGKRTLEKDGYSALVLGIGDAKKSRTNKAQAGQFEKIKVAPKKLVKELRCTPEFAAQFEIGGGIALDKVFEVGQFVDVQGKTRGRGFSGVVRRWSFAGFVQTHGTHEYRRHGGSIGTNMTPGRTLPNLKMPGQYGNETVTTLNLKVAKILPEKNLLLIEGGIPGSRNSVVVVRGAVKKKNAGKKA